MSETEPSPPPRQLTLRLAPAVRRRLDEFASSTRRTLNAAVELLIAEALDARTEKESDR